MCVCAYVWLLYDTTNEIMVMIDDVSWLSQNEGTYYIQYTQTRSRNYRKQIKKKQNRNKKFRICTRKMPCCWCWFCIIFIAIVWGKKKCAFCFSIHISHSLFIFMVNKRDFFLFVFHSHVNEINKETELIWMWNIAFCIKNA